MRIECIEGPPRRTRAVLQILVSGKIICDALCTCHELSMSSALKRGALYIKEDQHNEIDRQKYSVNRTPEMNSTTKIMRKVRASIVKFV